MVWHEYHSQVGQVESAWIDVILGERFSKCVHRACACVCKTCVRSGQLVSLTATLFATFWYHNGEGELYLLRNGSACAMDATSSCPQFSAPQSHPR